MPTLHLYFAFVLATTILMLIPGPMVALIVGTSVRNGTRYGLLTLAGSGAATLIHLTLVVIGLNALLGTLGTWFEWVRWIGVAYLVWLGIRQWMAPASTLSDGAASPVARSPRAVFLRGFLVSLTNPKTLLFYGAFFPQFVSSERTLAELLLLAVTYFLVMLVVDSGWAVAAGRARGLLSRHDRVRNRVSGALLIGAGLGLAAARHR